ncbi:MAG: ABC transporter substrate-binding protein [Chloroflexi bacterium]|nr:ABC transporter substrate-binding protein [Chloroflexota bacterium]
MNRFKRMLILFTLLALILSVFGTAMADEKVLVIGWSENTDAYDPANGFTHSTHIVNHVTYSQLVTFPDEDASQILPQLAESWEISDDGTVYTFSLRQDAAFANGDDITADDVVFSIQRLQNYNGNPSFLADGIDSVEAIDDDTVAFTLPDPRPSFLSEITSSVFSVTNADVIMANGGTDAMDAAETDTAGAYLDSTSAGSGPYILDNWEPQNRTELVRNENYWGDQPYFDRVIFIHMPEGATQKAALEAGDIHLAFDLSPDQITGLEGNADIEIYRGPSTLTHFVIMNTEEEKSGPFANPTVQLAVRYALDYEGYKTLWGGVTPGTNMWVGFFSAFGEDRAFSRDLDKARELLAEAGYADGLEMELEYPDMVYGGVSFNTNAQKIQADLAEVGINVTLLPGEIQVALERYRSGDHGVGYWLWGPDILDPLDFLSFMPPGKVATERNNWQLDSLPQDIQDMIAAAKVASDPDERMALFTALQEYTQQHGPFAPFNVPEVATAYRSNLQGYIWHPHWLLDVAILSMAE